MTYIPKGYQAVNPYLIVDGADKAIEFYSSVFGAKEILRMAGADGRIGHSEIRIDESTIMLADEYPEMDAKGPLRLGGSPVSIMLYVPDVDAVVAKAAAAGAKIIRPVEDQFYGDRVGGILDPFGHKWYVATHIKDVSPEELARGAKEKADKHAQ